jgi:hypothetical protein
VARRLGLRPRKFRQVHCRPFASVRRLPTSRSAIEARRSTAIIDGNGVSPAIKTVPNRDVAAHAKTLVLNPLASFAADVRLARVRFEIEFGDGTISALRSCPSCTATARRHVYRFAAG